jgi:putative ABC transport system permease protein
MNDLATSFFIAYKSVMRGSRSMLALMIFILTLSFLNMMFISGVLSGLWQTELQLVRDLATSDVTISPQQYPQLKQYISNQDLLRAQLQTIPGVIATARHYQLAGSLTYDKDNSGQLKSVSGTIIGIDPTAENKVLTTNTLLMKGQWLADSDTDELVLSSALAGGYGTPSFSDLGGVSVGDKLQVTYSNGYIRTYTVKGIYNDMMGSFQTFITAKEAESVLGVYNDASQILVKTDVSRMSATAYQARIQQMVPNLKLQNYNDLLGSVASFQQALMLISNIVGAISIMVAAITIFVLIYVNAVNKKRQIGILKAIGIKQKIIVNAYIMQSLFYTVCGLSVGALSVFGILDPLLVAHPIPIIVDLMYLSLSYTPVGVGTGILCFLIAGYFAGRVPAKMVAKKNIMEAIWG